MHLFDDMVFQSMSDSREIVAERSKKCVKENSLADTTFVEPNLPSVIRSERVILLDGHCSFNIRSILESRIITFALV